jgi:hypothetical protein
VYFVPSICLWSPYRDKKVMSVSFHAFFAASGGGDGENNLEMFKFLMKNKI